MSESNPDKAVSALVPAPVRCACGAVVRPLSLGAYALLEKAGSPLTSRRSSPPSALELLPSLYILTHDGRETLERFDQLGALSMEWADALPPSALGEIESAAVAQIRAMLDVVPQAESAKKKTSKTTDGSPASRSGCVIPTAGTSTAPSGDPPPAKPLSSVGNGCELAEKRRCLSRKSNG